MSELSEKQRDSLDEDQFAFPKERKEPLNNASHVRNAIARFNQVEGVSDDERDAAWSGSRKPPTSTASTSARRAGASSGSKADAQLKGCACRRWGGAMRGMVPEPGR